jgi:hypothetical protein
VQNERFVAGHLNKPSQVGLVFGRVDYRMLVVVKKAKESIEANVHAGGLQQTHLEGFEADSSGLISGADIAI